MDCSARNYSELSLPKPPKSCGAALGPKRHRADATMRTIRSDLSDKITYSACTIQRASSASPLTSRTERGRWQHRSSSSRGRWPRRADEPVSSHRTQRGRLRDRDSDSSRRSDTRWRSPCRKSTPPLVRAHPSRHHPLAHPLDCLLCRPQWDYRLLQVYRSLMARRCPCPSLWPSLANKRSSQPRKRAQ